MYRGTVERIGRQDGYLCQTVGYCGGCEYIFTRVCDGGVRGGAEE